MKYKYVISLFLIGLLFYLFGAWSKITHQAFADNIMLIAFCIMIISVLLAIIKIVTTNDKDSFLNK